MDLGEKREEGQTGGSTAVTLGGNGGNGWKGPEQAWNLTHSFGLGKLRSPEGKGSIRFHCDKVVNEDGTPKQEPFGLTSSWPQGGPVHRGLCAW